jgi:NDP-sugar pyrophosphorylase family protein
MSERLGLVFLAGGIGRRYGGLKQLAPVGPNGEAIIDLTIADAAAAGFDDVVFIIRHDIHDEMDNHLRQASVLPYQFAFQDDLPPPRAKPWGTAHALLSATEFLDRPFGVANADDYYDQDGIAQLAGWLRDRRRPDAMCFVTYRLGDTLSDMGTVSRGICDVDEQGRLVRCIEHLKIGHDGGAIRSEIGPLEADAPASMNLMGFDPSMVERIRAAWADWLARHADDPEDECRLPEVANDLVAAGLITVDVVRTDSQWVGITYTEDLELARAALAHRFE